MARDVRTACEASSTRREASSPAASLGISTSRIAVAAAAVASSSGTAALPRGRALGARRAREPKSPPGRSDAGTSTRSERATPGMRDSSPRRSSVLIIPFTVGELVPK